MVIEGPEESVNLIVSILGHIELLVAYQFWDVFEKKRHASNFFGESVDQILFDTLVERVVFCIDSTVKVRVSWYMNRSGYLGLKSYKWWFFIKHIHCHSIPEDFHFIRIHL